MISHTKSTCTVIVTDSRGSHTFEVEGERDYEYSILTLKTPTIQISELTTAQALSPPSHVGIYRHVNQMLIHVSMAAEAHRLHNMEPVVRHMAVSYY